ncbi:MAG: hypothetical protein ACE5FI_19325, partial [Anaerolineales bacterium]
MTATLVVVSSLWYLLFPPAAIGVLAVYCRVMSRAARAGLVHPRAIWLLRWALAGCAAFWSLTFLAAYFETELWIPVLAALLVVVMALLTRAARAGVHPGLRGFLRPLPADGLALFEEIHAPTAQRVRQWARRVAPLAPLLVLLALGAGSQVRRWPVLLALAGGLAAPLLLIAYRSAWVSPLALLLVTTTLGWRAASLDARLPAGTWTTPWAAARCAARVVPAGNGTAWCVNPHTQVIYHFQLGSGGVLEQFWLANAWDVFAANHA